LIDSCIVEPVIVNHTLVSLLINEVSIRIRRLILPRLDKALGASSVCRVLLTVLNRDGSIYVCDEFLS